MKTLLLTAAALGLLSTAAFSQTSYLSGSYFGGPAGSVITCTVRGNMRCCSIGGANVTVHIAPTCGKITTPNGQQSRARAR
jgi:hypothetical protein